MKTRFFLHSSLALLLGACLACGKSSTGPSFDVIGDFITSITASDGSSGARVSGSPPAPNGGPTLTATASGSVAAGGIDTVGLRASSPIQTVYVSVNGSDGFYKVQLQTSTTNISLSNQQGSQLPSGSYTASYRASAPGTGGLVGDPTTVTNTVTFTGGGGGGGSSSFTGTWGQGGTAVWVLTQSGNSVTGNEIIPSSLVASGVTITSPISGTVSGNTLTATNPITASSGGISCSSTSTIVATISGNTMTGTYTSGGVTCTPSIAGFTFPSIMSSGPFTLTRQ